jgi:flavin reductase (DIM6/NTAB) family NADH-FMN oxidoreductase RutF
MILHVKAIPAAERQQWLQSAIAPRPIALASTINKKGIVNLAPFSFFNLFSADPPILIFSPALRVRDGSRKHTLNNVEEVREVVINLVDEEILEQVNKCSADYPEGINELLAVGFTPEESTLVRPPRVKECKIQLECQVMQIIPLGRRGGAGNLIICEIQVMHVNDSIIGSDGKIDHNEYRPVARLGGDWYCAIRENNIFQLPKPLPLLQ